MNGRERIRGTTAIWMLSGVLGIAACGAAPPTNSGEELEQTSAALTAAKSLARGVVRDGTGAPIARARVDVRAAGGYRVLACATTAADGSFALDVRAGTYDLTVTSKTGFAAQAFPGQVIARGTALELIITRVPGTVNLTGRVTDQDGQPLSVSVCGMGCVGTDASGSFAITALSDQRLSIEGALGSAGSYSAALSFDPASSAPLAIVIPLVTLTGTVLDPSGAPMPNVSVSSPPCSEIRSDGLSGGFCLVGTQTDANGRFRFTVLPGDVVLQVAGDLGAYVTESVSGDTDVTVQVPPLQSLSGRITDRDGNGIPGHELVLTHPGCFSRFCTQIFAISDSSGSYQVDVSAGTYDAMLISPSSSSPLGLYQLLNTITLSEPTEIDFTFPDVTVTGTVLNVDGTPAPNVRVADNCHDANISGFAGKVCATQQTSDANGRFQMTLATPGDLVLTAYAATPTTSGPFTVTNDTDVVLQLQAAQPASGQVLAADGSPVAGLSVCYDPPTFTGSNCTTTDANGQYQMSLSPGTYSVLVGGSATGVRSLSLNQSVTVPSAPAIVHFAATGSTAIRLVNTDGSPRAGVALAADCFQTQASATTESICGDTLTSDAAGMATVVDGVGVAFGLEVGSGPDFESPIVTIDNIVADANTEVTIAIQSP